MKRRRLLSLLLALAMVLAVLPVAGAAESDVEFAKNTSGAEIAVYKTDSATLENKIGTVAADAVVPYLGTEGEYYKITYKAEGSQEGQEGYVMSKNFTLLVPTLVVEGAGTFTEDGTERTVTATVENGTGYKVEYKVDDGEWSETEPSLTEVGKLSIQIQATKEGKTTLTADATLEITAKVEPKLVVEGAGTFEYDGKAHTVTATVKNGEGYKIEYSTDGGQKWSETAPSLTEVGKLTIEVRATKAEQPELKETVTLEVTAKAEPKLVVEGAGTFTEDGTKHTVTATVENGEGYTVEYSTDGGKTWSTTAPSLTEAGTLTIQIRATKQDETTLTADATLKITAKVEPKLVVTGAGSFDYNGKAHTVTAKVENGEGYTVEYSTDGGKTWSTTAPSLTEAGTLTIKIRAIKSGAVTLTTADVTLVVKAAAPKPTMTVIGGKRAYDGKAYTVLVTFENAKATDFDIVYSTDGGKTWSATIPGQKEIGKLTIKVKATLKADKSVVLEGEGVVEIIAGTTTKTIGTIVNCRVSVNVRKGASSSTTKIGEARKGAQYTVLAVEGSWYKVQYTSTQVGYIHKDYISVKTVTETETPASSNQKVTIVNCKNSVNVRSGAGTSNSLIGYAPKNAQYQLLSTIKVGSDTWYKVQYTSAKVGYIHGDYIQVSTGTPGTPSAGQTVTIVNCNNSVNVREGAGTNTKKLGTAPKGATYKYLGMSSDGNWYKIQYTSSQVAYIHKNYIRLNSSSTTPDTPTGKTATIVNCNEWVNVREGAGTNTKKLGTAPKGKTYTYLGKSGNWIQVQYTSTQKGYIYSSYVKVSGSTGGSTGTDTAATGYGYVVNCNNSVNVRSGAGTNNGIIGAAPKSYVYQILGKNGSWYKIQYKADTVGYIHESYFSKATSDTTKKATVANCDEWVNVRSAATTSSAKLGQAKLGETFTYLKTMNSYVMVIYNGRVGCIHKNYAKIS